MERQTQAQYEGDPNPSGNNRDSENPDELQQDIHRTRERIDETLDAIKQQLSPGDLLSQVMGLFRQEGGGTSMGSKAGDVLSSLARTIKENPIPVALIGIGLLGLAKDGGGKSRGVARSRAGERTEEVTDKVQELAGEAREKAQDMAAEAREKVQDMAADARESLERVRERLEDDPIVLGALGIALGAALGAGLPSTRLEDELMGEKRDELADKAKQMGEQVRQGVRQVAGETMQALES
jgi:ElaB/YqjD/DUF883 family membrane-anchored ribosome-binding protein